MAISRWVGVSAVLLLAQCASSQSSSDGGSSGSGGATTSGGTTGASQGSGGVTGAGGAPRSGGASGAGGAPGSGGASGAGGAPRSGGTTGASQGSGGLTGAGGGNASSGKGTGGTTGAGGGSAGSGGSSGSSGSTSTGGGGASGSGSNGSGGSTQSASSGDAGAAASTSLRWVGRVVATDATSGKFAWNGAGLVATVSGSEIAVKLSSEASNPVYFQPVIDGTAGDRFSITSGSEKTVTLGTGLSSGDHTVELYRDTEGWVGISSFLGFTSGTLQGSPAWSGRLIEVVGDSISAGYGDLGTEKHPASENWVADPACHWSTENSSWYLTYAAVAGRALGAEVSTLARSGWGMYQDNLKSTANVLPSVWENALGPSDATKWTFDRKPDAVVINLGTNDFANDPGKDAYEGAYNDFLVQVRAKYPDAWLFLTIGSMTADPQLTTIKGYLDDVVQARKALGDDRVSSFDFPTQPLGADGLTPTGCDWHPNVAEHATMAGMLKTQLQSALGW